MAGGEFKHKTVGVVYTQQEFEHITRHELDSGVEGDFIYWDATALVFKRIAHQSDLDAHTRHIFEILRTGEYYWTQFTGSNINKALVADTLYAVPFLVPRTMTFDYIGIQVTAQAGQKFRMGIYENGTNLYPGDLVVDAGETTLAAIGIKTRDIDPTQLTKGLYWLAIVSDGTPTIVVRYEYAFHLLGAVATDFTSTGEQTHWEVAQVYGALPDPFTGGGSLATGVAGGFRNFPGIHLRLKSLD